MPEAGFVALAEKRLLKRGSWCGTLRELQNHDAQVKAFIYSSF
jgi:hypothetical protein